jgi:uncharacterized protein (DUF2384 family)
VELVERVERAYPLPSQTARVLPQGALMRIISIATQPLDMSALPKSDVAPQPGPTLAKAVTRAAEFLGLNQSALADALGMSRATASRLVAGAYVLDPSRRKEWELALLFARVFRSLDAIVGHGEQARKWMTGPNLALGGRPADLVRTAEGLVRTVQYLDAARGRI